MKTHHVLCRLGIVLAAVVSPTWSYGSSIFFTPAGAQLDGDQPPDIEAPPPAMITFEIFANVTAGPGRVLQNLTYVVGWDTSELAMLMLPNGDPDVTLDVNGQFATDSSQFLAATPAMFPAPPPPALNGHPNFEVMHTGGAIAGGVAILLDRLRFRVLTTTNDGRVDFGFFAVAATGTALDTFDFSQIVSVQPPPPAPVPEPSGLLLAAASGSVLLLRMRRRAAVPRRAFRCRMTS
jgi:hypothetical protein